MFLEAENNALRSHMVEESACPGELLAIELLDQFGARPGRRSHSGAYIRSVG